MFPAWLGTLGTFAGGMGQLAGGISGLFGGGGYDNTAANQSFAQNQFNAQMAWNREQFDWQKLLATDGIRMRVNDAKAAGLHPLAAIGGGSAGYSPTTLVGSNVPDGGGGSGGHDIGSSLANMGQGISRALAATSTPEEKVDSAFEMTRKRQMIEKGDLENAFLASQIQKINNPAQVGPGLPSNVGPFGGGQSIPGQPNTYEPKPPEVQNRERGTHVEAGPAQPEVSFNRTATGLAPQMGKSFKGEGDLSEPLSMQWLIRNQLVPMLGQQGADGRPVGAPSQKRVNAEFPGATGVYWDYARFEWRPTYHPSGKGAVGRYIDWRMGK